jgi:hypothetical protein
VSKNGASGEPWKDTKVDKDGKLKNPRRSAEQLAEMNLLFEQQLITSQI